MVSYDVRKVLDGFQEGITGVRKISGWCQIIFRMLSEDVRKVPGRCEMVSERCKEGVR